MDLELNCQEIGCFETVVDTTLYQEETAESIVPDSCPDIAWVLLTTGLPLVTERTVQEGKGELAGQVRAAVLYLPEGEAGLRRLDLSVPFRISVTGSEIVAGARMAAVPTIRAIETRVLNPRKVLVRADLAVGVRIYAPATLRLCGEVQAPEQSGVEQRRGSIRAYFTVSVQEKDFTYSDELPLAGSRGAAEELLEQRVELRCSESKIIGSKLIFKGDAELRLLFRTAEGLESADFQLPFSQVMEVAELGEETDCDLTFQLTDLRCELGSDGGPVYVNFDVLAQAVIREQRELPLVRDLYSTVCPAQVEYRTDRLWRRLGSSADHQALRELVELDRPAKTILDVRVDRGLLSCARDGDQMAVTQPLSVRLLYLAEDDQICCALHQTAVTSRFDCGEGAVLLASCTEAGDVFATPASGGAEVRCALDVRCVEMRRDGVVSLKSAALQEPDPAQPETERPSIVLRQMQPDESLWDVAKSCRTTRAVILGANELADEEECRGRMLLIPRVR